MALQSYLKTRQCEDLRQDIAAGLNFLGGPFSAGERVWYYHIESENPKFKRKYIKRGERYGGWIRGKVIATDGAMATVDLGTRIIVVN